MRILNIRHVIQRSDTSHKEFVPSYTSILFIRRDGVTRFDIMVNLSFFIFFIEGVQTYLRYYSKTPTFYQH
jgi:hypothetical protein